MGPLTVVSSSDAHSDGEDYIEGGGGDDIIFGGLGQDDIVGGSSTFFSLGDPTNEALEPNPDYPGDPEAPEFLETTVGANLRPDGNDYIFGGSGERIARNNYVGGSAPDPVSDPDSPDDPLLPLGGDDPFIDLDERHARDADVIAGDNANIIRIVGRDLDTTDGIPAEDIMILSDGDQLHLSFEYDDYGNLLTERIIVRGVELLDYTAGGPDFRPDLLEKFDEEDPDGPPAGPNDPTDPLFRFEFDLWARYDIGGHDEVHGGSGDDFIYLMGGHDRAFGDAEDDDIIGGWGNDWVSGGTGQDCVIGDDGRIFTSRNHGTPDGVGFSEPLYAIRNFLDEDPDPRHPQIIHGNVIDEFVYTPGQVQTAILNVNLALDKTVDITPYNLTPNADGGDDPLFDANVSDDIIFGGLDDDFLHGASGDDAIAGGEALEESYAPRFDDNGNLIGIVRTDFTRPWNPGDVLKFGDDTDPWNAPKPIQSRLGEFFLYDEYDPRRTILFNAAPAGLDDIIWKGSESSPGDQLHYFLNQVADEGQLVEGEIEFEPNGTPISWAYRHTDGDDVMFGDLGNDWQVGGTGNDTIWAGWGNDLSNADDVLTDDVPGGDYLNEMPDTHPEYEDRVFGGAGLDILIGNTGGDRLIDWAGEFNSYIVPFSPFGIATVSRQRPPQLDMFLYKLSESQGADPTRTADVDIFSETRAARNGEPDGEIGLIMQQDHGLWQEQTGGPTDPQPGNIPGGGRDVKRTADFNGGPDGAFHIDSGVWNVNGGRLEVAPEVLGGDAASVFYIDDYLPQYFEIKATINAGKPTAGLKSNAFMIFDYYSPTDFKYAGINISNDKLEMGYRDETGWHELEQDNARLKPNRDYEVLLAINGIVATLVVDGRDVFTHVFAPRIIDGYQYNLNAGLVGIGAYNSMARIDNVAVQVLPPEWTYEDTEDFDDGTADLFAEQTPSWRVMGNQYEATGLTGEIAFSMYDLNLAFESVLAIDVTVRTDAMGGLVFDAYDDEDFKFVALSAVTNEIVIGHYTARHGLEIDAAADWTILGNRDYELSISVSGMSVSVNVDGQAVLGHAFNGLAVDGDFGLLTIEGASSFDDFTIKTNDPAFRDEGDNLMATVAPPTELDEGTVYLTDGALTTIVNAAIARWTEVLGINNAMLASLHEVSFCIVDFDDLTLGRAVGNTVLIDIDAAGFGWFVDETPFDDAEFGVEYGDRELLGTQSSDAFSHMDLLTVVMHELGHVLGFEDLDPEAYSHNLMSATLASGVRRLNTEVEMTTQSLGGQVTLDFSFSSLLNDEDFALHLTMC
jgi:Ca2+-binding RTX toxin-like protein